jgi:hypothetical protein
VQIYKCDVFVVLTAFSATGMRMLNTLPGLEITADQRSMIGRKLFLIGEEARLPFILIGEKYI